MSHFYILENNLRNVLGHFLNSALGIKLAAQLQGHIARVFANTNATPEVLQSVDGKGLFRHLSWPTRNYEGGATQIMKELGEAFYEDCKGLGEIPEECVLMVPTCLEPQVYGLACFVHHLRFTQPKTLSQLKIICNFHWENISEDPQRAELYERAFDLLQDVLAPTQIFLTAHTQSVAQKIQQHSAGLKVHVLPMPLYYGERPPEKNSATPTKPILTVLGRSIPRKGSTGVLDLVDNLYTRSKNLRFRIQSTTADARTRFSLLFKPRIRLIAGGMSLSQYLENLTQADIFLLPYNSAEYAGRSSGVFAECAAMGGVAIVPRHTWMSKQIEEGLAAGVCFDPDLPGSIENAVVEAVENLGALRETALRLVGYWWREASAFGYIAAVHKLGLLPPSNASQNSARERLAAIDTHSDPASQTVSIQAPLSAAI